MTDLNKYRRQNHNLLAKTEGVGNKRQKKYVEKITINLTQEEADTLNKMNEDLKHLVAGLEESPINNNNNSL